MIPTNVLASVTRLVHSEVNPHLFQEEILPGHKLREDLRLDSLRLVTLSVAIEDEFGIIFDPINMDLVAIFDTVESLATFVASHSSMPSISS